MVKRNSYKLSEISQITDCEHKTAPAVEHSSFLSIRTSDILNGRLNYDAAYRVSEETYATWTNRAVPTTNDIILAREAPVGEVGIITNGYNICLGQRTVLLSNFSDKVYSPYLLYYLCSPKVKYDLQSRSTGSVVLHLNVKDIREFAVELPPLPEQKAIASVLSSLDDKIDLLHRQNKTLEAMAETLFRQWFVEDADDGWEKKPLGDMIEVKRGGSPRPIHEYISEYGYRWLKISDVTKLNSPFIFEIKEKIKEDGLKKTVLLGAGSLVLSNSATPGIPKILSVDSCIHDGWLYFPESILTNEFLYLLFKRIRPHLIQQGNGSIFTNLKTDILKGYEIPVPKPIQLHSFQELITPIFEKMKANAQHIMNVEKQRDLLLPKLMNGEVIISE